MTQSRPLTVSAAQTGLKGQVTVPGDKSISHRALMLAALAQGTTKIYGLLEGEDVICTSKAVEALGAKLQRNKDFWLVEGCGVGHLKEPGDVLNMGNSGTAARLLAGVLATHPIVSMMTGDGSLRTRPMGRVSDPLSETGAKFVTRDGKRLPMTIIGTGDGKPLHYKLPVASAQVKSAIMLAGLNCTGQTCVEEPVATRDHTENMLRHFGLDVSVTESDNGGRFIRFEGPASLKARDIIVPGDPSSAAFPVVAALLIPNSEVVIENIGLNLLRTGIFTTLLEMGASIEIKNERIEGGEKVGDLHVKASTLHGVTVPAERAPSMIDEYPILSVACALAQGTSRLQGLAELRVKESDRLASTVALLESNGATVSVENDDIIIQGQTHLAGGGLVKTHMDHRLAMSGIILGLVAQKAVKIDDTAFIETSFPGFVTLMNNLGAGIKA
ncbi:3-phosphoshikimate 1-carboxyvinyltransferase [Aristophania vespae]|uniref:3-phosphoshikimate 1-carboxyvinyltransferase n=1 Tax=Aristophania vespae TaxID=2697033 RepID=UPI0023510981|nr:3-phosphoshikimate 1-carboxyvinyltransferase [Aristophania vespae]UMM64257.1 3-phosphoshikimate 1-carboxyvinyltransferase [Aristophania vespae]